MAYCINCINCRNNTDDIIIIDSPASSIAGHTSSSLPCPSYSQSDSTSQSVAQPQPCYGTTPSFTSTNSSCNQSILSSSIGNHASSSLADQSHSIQSTSGENKGLDHLLLAFATTHSTDQVVAIYDLSGSDYEASMCCLSDGPVMSSITEMLYERFKKMPRVKLSIESSDLWGDMVAAYKGHMNFNSQLRITLDNQPAIDTGGVRRQVYTTVYDDFAFNKTVQLFEGPENSLRPIVSAEVKSFGLLKIIGSMIAHSICQDGIGFPYMSPTCYWYMVGGEEKALEFAKLDDLPSDAAHVVSEV